MSKIEKALRKAQSGGALRVVSGGSSTPTSAPSGRGADTHEDAQFPVVTPPVAGGGDERASAAIAISRMHEPSVLGRTELDERRIIYPEMGDQSVAQVFRQIRTRIIQRTQTRNAIIMVTSVVPGGGSSFLAKNLGVAFAFDAGKTALVVDCNLRRPALNQLLRGPSPCGLTDYLEHPEMDVREIIHAVGVERLRVIPAGAPREIPAEYFTSARMRQCLDSIKRRYRERFIILDAPPMTEMADTQILAELCDLVILVAPYARVTLAQLEASAKAIDKDKFFGVVFNGEPQFPHLDWKEMVAGHLGALKEWAVRLSGSLRGYLKRIARR